jgi:hypothetical protein
VVALEHRLNCEVIALVVISEEFCLHRCEVCSRDSDETGLSVADRSLGPQVHGSIEQYFFADSPAKSRLANDTSLVIEHDFSKEHEVNSLVILLFCV